MILDMHYVVTLNSFATISWLSFSQITLKDIAIFSSADRCFLFRLFFLKPTGVILKNSFALSFLLSNPFTYALFLSFFAYLSILSWSPQKSLFSSFAHFLAQSIKCPLYIETYLPSILSCLLGISNASNSNSSWSFNRSFVKNNGAHVWLLFFDFFCLCCLAAYISWSTRKASISFSSSISIIMRRDH